MKKTTGYRAKVAFFYMHAAWGYRPAEETRRRGRYNGARALAFAEMIMIDNGTLVADWGHDGDIRSDDWITADDDYEGGHSDSWATYCVSLRRADSGEIVGSLGGIDFGRHGSPDSDDYARVVVAELAAEALIASQAAGITARYPSA